MGWWGDSVPEETLSRDEASRVLRRLFRMLRPQRALIALATLVLMGQAAALLAGPALVRHGIDAGLLSNHGKGDGGALDRAVTQLRRYEKEPDWKLPALADRNGG